MDIVLIIGIVLFFVGLVVSHVVVAITRSTVRAKKPLKKAHRLMMWGSLAMVALGLIMSVAAWYVLNHH